MASQIKNIIIFVVIATFFILVYIFFIKKPPEPAGLVSSSETQTQNAIADSKHPSIAKDFLALLLNVKNIKLDDNIFSDVSFSSLHDSSIILNPDGTEGRPNPFAPFGTESTQNNSSLFNKTGPKTQ